MFFPDGGELDGDCEEIAKITFLQSIIDKVLKRKKLIYVMLTEKELDKEKSVVVDVKYAIVDN